MKKEKKKDALIGLSGGKLQQRMVKLCGGGGGGDVVQKEQHGSGARQPCAYRSYHPGDFCGQSAAKIMMLRSVWKIKKLHYGTTKYFLKNSHI